jgi:integrase
MNQKESELELFVQKLKLQTNLSEGSISTYRNIASLYQPFNDLSREKIAENLQNLKANSHNTHLATLRHLMKLGFISEALIEDIKFKKTPKSKVQSKKELFTAEEAMNLIRSAGSLQMQTFFYVLYESGARVREIIHAQITDVLFDELGVLLHVSGKTGYRDIRLIKSYSYLVRWINHRGEAPGQLWEIAGKKLSYKYVYDQLQALAKKCNIKKKVYPHLFRHTRATELVSQVQPSILEKYLGWTELSDMVKTYSHLDSTDIDNAFSKLYGLDQQEEKNPLQVCSRCQMKVIPEENRCPNCNALMIANYQTSTYIELKRSLLEDERFTEFLKEFFREKIKEEKEE